MCLRLVRNRKAWTWILYVVFAVAGASFPFLGARAQQVFTNDEGFRKLIDGLCQAWSTGTVQAPAQFYAKDDDLVFYDIAPLAYDGWNEYAEGVRRLERLSACSLLRT